MDSILIELYEIAVIKHKPEGAYYKRALEPWSLAKGRDWLDLEDAAHMREYEWGFYAFQAGIRLGLSLPRPEYE